MSASRNIPVSTRPRLRAVSGSPQSAWITERPPIDLRAWPFRPGEAPVSRFISLPSGADTTARRHARGVGLPLALWIRVAVEASRAAAQVSRDTGAAIEDVGDSLSRAARDHGHRDDALSGRDWASYAAALLSGHSLHLPRTSPIELLLPEEMAVAWDREAAGAGLALGDWVGTTLNTAPEDCVAWEAASARDLRPLGEWAYSAWARCDAASSASPYRR